MTSFYYYDQNPSAFCYLVLIRAFVIQPSMELQNLNMKGKTKMILVIVVKWRQWPILSLYCLCLNEWGRNSQKDICGSNHLDFPRLLRELQNSNSPKNEHCKNFLEEMQLLFLYFVHRGSHNGRLKDLEGLDLTWLVFPPDCENLT